MCDDCVRSEDVLRELAEDDMTDWRMLAEELGNVLIEIKVLNQRNMCEDRDHKTCEVAGCNLGEVEALCMKGVNRIKRRVKGA